jgi:hypothetical protein
MALVSLEEKICKASAASHILMLLTTPTHRTVGVEPRSGRVNLIRQGRWYWEKAHSITPRGRQPCIDRFAL